MVELKDGDNKLVIENFHRGTLLESFSFPKNETLVFITDENDRVFTIFHYNEISSESTDTTCVMQSSLIVEGNISSIRDFTCKKIEARFQNLAIILPSDFKKQSNSMELNHHGVKYTVSLERINNEAFLTIETELAQPFNLIKNVLFSIKCILTVLTNTNISYQELYYYNEQNRRFFIADIEPVTENDIDEKKVNYQISSINENVIDFIIKPMTSIYLDSWITYAAVKRNRGLLEDKYLNFARCLELFVKADKSTQIYSENERRSKAKVYKKAIDALEDLDKDYKDNLKSVFKYSNEKKFYSLLKDDLKDCLFEKRLITVSRDQEIENLAKDLVDTRDFLSHSNAINQVDNDELIWICRLLEGIVILFMLEVHGVKLNQEKRKIKWLLNKYKRPIPLDEDN